MTTLHPTDDELNDFLLGKTSDTDHERVAAHVSECEDCVARATAIEGRDTLVELLASAGTRIDAEMSAAATPQPQNTSSEVASTHAWDGVPPVGSNVPVPPLGLSGHPRYRLVRQIGQGGMGSVWLAEHTIMGRPVALKVIRPEFLARPGAVERFRREVRAAAQLHHTNIVTAYDADEADGLNFLVMEYVPGETLSDVVKRGPLPAHEACSAVRDAARGLAHAHAAGLVHRDVKPANLIRAVDGTVKVLDFGLVATGTVEGTALTGENVVMGTPDYIAPEQAEDARSADARSDVYSLGCTLYHLLAGRVPFPADSTLKKLDAHRTQQFEPISNLPAGLEPVLTKMTAKRPGDRHQTASEVAEALEPFCRPFAEPIASATRGRRSGRRWVAVATALLAVVAVAAGGVIYKVKRDHEEITIETNDPDIEVTMRRNGELIRIVDTKTKQAWELDATKMRLKPDGSDLSIDLPGQEPLVIRRNGDVAVTIKREPKVGEVRVIPTAVAVETPPFEQGRRLVGTGARWGGIAFSPDGTHLIAAGIPVGIWDVATGRLTRQLDPTGPAGSSRACYSGDGKLAAATLSADKTVRVWEAATGREVVRFGPFKAAAFWGLTFSPDAKHLLFSYDARVYKGDLAAGTAELVFDEKLGECRGLTVSPDGTLVAHNFAESVSGRISGTGIRVWNLATGEILHRWAWPTDDSITQLVWLRGGKELLAGHGRGSIRVWSVATGVSRITIPTQTGDGMVESVAPSPDGRRAVSTGTDGRVCVWDLASGAQLAAFEKAHPTGGMVVAFSPDGKTVASSGKDGVVRLWRLTDPVPAGSIQLQTEAHVNALALSPDGTRALAGGDDGKVFVWDTATGRTTMWFPVRHSEYVLRVAWSPDGRKAISGDSKGGVVVWDAVEGKALHVFPAGNVSLVVGVGFFPDGNRLWGCRQNRLTVWDAKSGKEALTIDPPIGTPFHHAALSPVGDRFLTADNGVARLWDAANGVPGLKLESGYTSWVGKVAFAPDGKRVASGDNGGRVFVWELAGGTREWSVKAHPVEVFWLAFTPDGQRLVTVPNAAYRGYNPIKVWAAADGRPLGDIARLSNTHDRILTRDGRQMLAGDGKGVVQAYTLPELPNKP